ncbi:VIR protein [Plasmodium vivax]|uniref:VIR protein n=1 Tax=Plasmodium vivax TaxID=5855 RepID=A0A1G4ECV4_PLAVI|nr:VIR protein [Plasmodium vivax]
MDDSNQDYDTFEQYNYNHDVYEQIKGAIGNEFDSFPNEILGEPIGKKNSITMDCLRLRKYLRNFHINKGCKNNNCCQYINYVLNKMVNTHYDSNQSIFDIYKSYMNHKSNNKEIMNLCLTEINYMHREKYKKIELLYNAYKTCQFYISNKHNHMSCNRAKSCIRAYENIMTNYKKRDDTKFCKALKDLKVFLEKNEPPLTSNCDSRFADSLSYPYDLTKLLQESEEIKASIGIPQMGLQLPGTPRGPSEEPRQGIPKEGSPGVLEQGVRESVVRKKEGGIEMQETTNLFDTQTDANGVSTDSPSAKTNSPAGTIIGTSLGFVLPLITIYRFTPLGNWVNTKVLGRDKLMDNMKKNELEFLLNSAQTQEMNSGDIKYRIKYNSVLNE